MKAYKLVSVFITVLLILNLTACRKAGNAVSSSAPQSTGSQTASANEMTLLYSSADTFNPYTLQTEVNRQLCKLLYDPLVKTDQSFEPVNCLAKSIQQNGKEVTVLLANAVFSDNSAVTPEDVTYSYRLAKASSTSYATKLYEVSSASEISGGVVFKLSKNDPFFANVLDFPIVKKNSDTVKDSDSVLLPPIGAGRYKLNATHDGLVINPLYFGKKGSVEAIRLLNAPDSESVSHYAQVGAVDMYYTEINDGNNVRMDGKRCDVNLTNLVYIGINRNVAPLNKNELRQALAMGIDRTKICTESYYNNAVPATGFFHPDWNPVKSVQNLQKSANLQITVENLEEIGYNKLNEDGIRINANGQKLAFTLLVNSENRIRVLAARTIATQLLQAGIKVTVAEKSYAVYNDCLKNGNFQLYLGEVKLTENMDFSPLVFNGGTAAFGNEKTGNTSSEQTASQTASSSGDNAAESGTASTGTSLAAPEAGKPIVSASETVLNGFYAGNNTITDVATVLQSEMPLVPVCYRTGALFYGAKIQHIAASSLSDIYFSIDSYIVK